MTARKPNGEPVYKDWYRLSRWQKLRARQLAKEPLCAFCRKRGRVEPATVCDHVTPHRGNEVLFWGGPFQSLCRTCHNVDKKLIENGKPPPLTFGVDGWPL